MSPTPSDFILNKNDINDFDGLLCASNIDFIPEVHISCHLCSTWIRMGDGIRGSLKVDQCNMEIQNISIGVLQHEKVRRWCSCLRGRKGVFEQRTSSQRLDWVILRDTEKCHRDRHGGLSPKPGHPLLVLSRYFGNCSRFWVRNGEAIVFVVY